MAQPDPTTVDEYLAAQPAPMREALDRVRAAIHTALPDSTETLAYKMPAVEVNGKAVVYFAGWKKHLSVYPVPAGDAAFEAAIAPYLAGKGSLNFPLKNPIPYELIAEIATRLAAQRAGH
ncbi:iron chaperone [Nocardia sp. JMUB6875]|uniref:iron chaperone n=1 Tax=Nocardia sp. JMUB6875 TaxID=3158170 RepID=UPI0032E5B7FC